MKIVGVQRTVRIPFAGILCGEFFLGALFVRVGPIEDLFLDELTGGQRLERRAGEVEICLGRDRQEILFFLRKHGEVFVHILQPGGLFELLFLLGDGLFLAREQFFGGLAPCAEMIFVEHHKVPVDGVKARCW